MKPQVDVSVYNRSNMRAEDRQNEAALAAAARRGDKEALRKLFERNWCWLKGLVYSIVCDAEEVDDILQEVCLRVIEKISGIREPERFGSWLAVIARRVSLRHRQKIRERARSLSEDMTEQVSDEKAEKLFEAIEQVEECQKILGEIRALPEKYREVFMLSYSGDLTYRQMAEILDVPITTVQIRLVRARRMVLERVTGKDKGKVQGT
jgi:RNA polymerase sigma-70 factor (ECF subfamily)